MNSKTHFRIIPQEYTHIPEGKEALAQRISAHRQRLIETRYEQLEEKKLKQSSSQDPLLTAATLAIDAIPAFAADFIAKKPIISLTIGAGSLAIIGYAVKRIGLKRLMQGANTVTPVVVKYLKIYVQNKHR